MKRTISFLLAVLTVVALLPMSLSAKDFSDVTDGKWYTEGIRFCQANGYMSGTTDTYFDRNSNLTRAMFMTILAKVDKADLKDYEGESDFTDVKTDAWYSTAITWASRNGLATGIADGVFGYKNPVTREQMALFLYSYANYVNAGAEKNIPGIDTDKRADLSVFADADRVHDWARDAMEWAVAATLFSGVDEDTLDSRGNCTRAQTAVLIRAFVLGFLTDCEHEWVEADCSKSGYCKKCKIFSSKAYGHVFGEFRCNRGATCSRCKYRLPPQKCSLTELSCFEDSYCTVCGRVSEVATGHVYVEGKCKFCAIKEDPDDPYVDFYHELKEKGTIMDDYGRIRGFSDTGKDQFGFDMECSIRMNESNYGRAGAITLHYRSVNPQTKHTYFMTIILENADLGLYSFRYECPLATIEGGFYNTIDKSGSFTLYRSYNEKHNANVIHLAKVDIVYTLKCAERMLNENSDLSLADIGFDTKALFG